MNNKKTTLITAAIIVFAFFWIFSLTYNFNFFWEDIYLLGQHKICQTTPAQCSPQNMFVNFIKTLYQPSQFENIRYGWKPIQEEFIYPFLASIAGNNLIYHRIIKAILFTMLFYMYWWFLFKPTENFKPKNSEPIFSNNYLIPVLAFTYLLVLPEIWVAALYYVDTLILTLLFSTSALAIFYFSYDSDNLKNKTVQAISFIAIVFLTNLSILTKHVGRLNVFLITAFLVLTAPKKCTKKKYVFLLTVLLFLSIPVFGLTKATFGGSFYDVLGLNAHINAENKGLFNIIYDFASTIHLSFLPHAIGLIILFAITAILNIYAIIKKKQKNTESTISLHNIMIFSAIWFLLEAFALFIARTFVMDPKYFLRFEFTIFLFPQTLFILSYVQFVHRKYFEKNKLFKIIICLLIIGAILHNTVRLNEWRGGWGAYFLEYDTARQFIDKQAKNSILLVKMDHAAPTYFACDKTNNTIKMIADLSDVNAIKSFALNYSDVFVAQHQQQIKFKNKQILNIANLTATDNSPYGNLKSLLGKYYQDKIYIYKLQNIKSNKIAKPRN